MNKQEIDKAIEILKDIYPSQKEIKTGEYDHVADALDIAISALEQQLADMWIPISERLPTMQECQENDCRFIVTDGNRTYQDWFDYEEKYFDRCRCDGTGLKIDKCVIAWMPLPSPYKEGKV